MGAVRIRILLNKGRRGVPLRKLVPINVNMGKFLTMLGADLGLFSGKQEWLAVGFDEVGSVAYDIECPAPIEDSEIRQFGEVLKDIAQLSYDVPSDKLSDIQPITIKQYARVAEVLDADEEIGIGIYYNGTTTPAHWENHSKKKANEIISILQDTILSYGSIQGTISSLYKSNKAKMHFSIRELASGGNIRCYFDEKFYNRVVDLLGDPDQVVFVYGAIKLSRINRKIDELIVEDLIPAPEYKKGDLSRFFGSSPDLTGDLSTDDFVDNFRADFD